MSFSGVLSGIVIVAMGFFVLVYSSYFDAYFVSLVIGIILVSVGLYMVINTNKEDKIEQIRKK